MIRRSTKPRKIEIDPHPSETTNSKFGIDPQFETTEEKFEIYPHLETTTDTFEIDPPQLEATTEFPLSQIEEDEGQQLEKKMLDATKIIQHFIKGDWREHTSGAF